jgi:hypothetical protein
MEKNETGRDNEDESDYDDECSRPQKRAKDGNHCLPWVSTDSDTTALTQHEGEEEYGGRSDGEEIGGAASKSTHTRHMQLWTHLQDICDQERTYKRHAIGIAPTRDMQLKSHLQDRCNWNCTYKTDVIGIAPTTSKCARTRLMQLWTKPTRHMQLGTHPPVIKCVVPFCQFMFYINTSYELCLKG